MSQRKNNTERKKGQHLELCERKIIEAMLKKGFKRKEIAEAIGIAQSTLCDEIRRGEVQVQRVIREPELKRNYYHGKETVITEWAYSAVAAQTDADFKREKGIKHFKVFAEDGYVEFIENLILNEPNKHSPDTANAIAKAQGYNGVSTKTLYNWIEWGLLKIKPMDLLLKVKRKPRSKIKTQKRKYGKSIDERPKEVESREEYGHLEGDSMVGKDGKGQIITLVERKTRIAYTAIFKDKKAQNIITFLKRLKKRYGERFKQMFKSITFDNGSEFAYNKKMSRYCNIYYAHAYSSWERGSNENFNGILRRFIPKGSDITKLKQTDVERICHYINTMPRKIHGYKTALEMFQQETAAI